MASCCNLKKNQIYPWRGKVTWDDFFSTHPPNTDFYSWISIFFIKYATISPNYKNFPPLTCQLPSFTRICSLWFILYPSALYQGWIRDPAVGNGVQKGSSNIRDTSWSHYQWPVKQSSNRQAPGVPLKERKVWLNEQVGEGWGLARSWPENPEAADSSSWELKKSRPTAKGARM